MVRKVVTVDEGLHLPTAVQDQLRADLDTEFATYVTNAQTAAGNASVSAGEADVARDEAVAAAGVATAPTDSMVATLIGNPSSLTTEALTDFTEDLVGDGFIRRFDDKVSVLDWSALPISGSTRAGNIQPGAYSRQVNPAGAYEAFPGLTLCPDGSLLLIYRSASAHGWAPGSITKAVRSNDLGQTWSAPFNIFSKSGYDVGFGMLTTLSDGRIACIGQYRNTSGSAGALCVVMFSSDNGNTWGTEIVVPFSFNNFTYASGNLIEMTNGNLLAIGYGRNNADTYTSTRTMVSADGGLTWSNEQVVANGPALTTNFNEATINYLPNGQIMALVRSEDAPRKIWRSVSNDLGNTWSTPTALFEGWGRPAWIKLSSGGLVMTYRGNTDLSHFIRTSWDNGVTWSSPRLMAGTTPTQSVYTQMVEVSPGLVAVAYSDDISTTSANTRFKYLMDGTGISPMGDVIVARPDSWVGVVTGGFTATPATAVRASGSDVQFRDVYLVRTSVTFAVTAGTQFFVVAAGGIPAELCPSYIVRVPCLIRYTSAPGPAEALFYPDGSVAIVAGASGTLPVGTYGISIPRVSWERN